MQAEIITIGDEILIGQIVDTNSKWIAEQLNKIGISVYQITSIQDDKQHIIDALDLALKKSNLVIITGGLGPTKDDITKHTLTQYFKDELVQNSEIEMHIKALFAKINYPYTALDLQQALLPKKATILKNNLGTASGMWFFEEDRRPKTEDCFEDGRPKTEDRRLDLEDGRQKTEDRKLDADKSEKIIISLPGVPNEMKGLMSNEVIPKLKEQFKLPFIFHKTLITYGMGESNIAKRLENFEANLPKNIKLAYLPSYGKTRLRLTAKGTNKTLLEINFNKAVAELKQLVNDILLGDETQEEIQIVLGKLLTKKGYTISTTESCTGGNIAQLLTSVPGSSAYFIGSVVSYNVRIKTEFLKVSQQTIDKYSVVSSQVAKEMAENIKHLYKTDFAIATTGNAGPTTDKTDKTVGDVFIAIATPTKTIVKEYNFGQPRARVIEKATIKALELVYRLIE